MTQTELVLGIILGTILGWGVLWVVFAIFPPYRMSPRRVQKMIDAIGKADLVKTAMGKDSPKRPPTPPSGH